MKRIRFLFTPAAMAVLLVIMAAVLALATFIENDFGAETARAMVYNTRWFELLFLLLAINLTGQIINFKLYKKEKLTIMLFHAAFILMIAGAAITRYTGYDGMMHIREGETTSETFSTDNVLEFVLTDQAGNLIASHTRSIRLKSGKNNLYSHQLRADGQKVRLTISNFYPQSGRKIEESSEGTPVVSLLVTRDMTSSEVVIISDGEKAQLGGLTAGLNVPAEVSIITDSGAFFIRATSELKLTNMQAMESAVYRPDTLLPLSQGIVYTAGGYRIMPQQLTMSGEVVPVLLPAGSDKPAVMALECTLSGQGFEKRLFLWEDTEKSRAEWKGIVGEMNVMISYGSRSLSLPFTLRLDDFIIDRYPGSNSPSGFRSIVTVSDDLHGSAFSYDIYMNHILRHRGYRFYQSSYDNDEQGTILSVNHDPAGMIVTYAGYALLFLFIVLSVMNRRSFFRTVIPGYWGSRYAKSAGAVIAFMLLSSFSPLQSQHLVIEKKAADRFGEVLAQDQKGRTKPLYTISSDILRKVARENRFGSLSPMQVFLGCSLDFYHWQHVPMIKVSNDDLRKILGIKSDMAAFSDIVSFSEGGAYKLASYVAKAYEKPVSGRTRFDKEVIKVDERVNICYMMSQSDFLRIFPLRDGTDHWGKPGEAVRNSIGNDDSLFVLNLLPLWAQAVTAVGKSTAEPEEYLEALKQYQEKHSSYDLPPAGKVKAELFYYKAGIFERLFPYYATLGLLMIIVLIASIINTNHRVDLLIRVLAILVGAGFVFHTLGLGIRWYISGHSPMSNGYESMLFISWVTVLAGFIFSCRSMLALAATSVLAGLTLMVAHLSFMDPEITNLVPVLRSYWLTLHVSVITGSYGFLGLGAILGLIVMLMMLFTKVSNRQRIGQVIDELTVINYRTLTLGLYFLTIGTFLGAIWANESWGRYWGWDPKETWSLITIIVYTLVTHSRMIPGMKDVYVFNLLSVLAFSSVLMTYFGVNYYLSGLHSYAGGDPVQVPVFVYVTVVVLAGVAAGAWYKYRKIRVHN